MSAAQEPRPRRGPPTRRPRVAAALLGGALAVLLAAPARPAAAQELTEERRIAVAERLQRSSVSIRAGRSSGSGFVVGRERWIVTNAHVVRQGGRSGLVVRFGSGETRRARLVALEPRYDLAVLQVEGEVPVPPLPLGDSSRVRVGQTVLAFGSPFGLDGTLTQGIVSARRHVDGAGDGVRELIQTDAPINPGNSGGPLVDANGEVIGVNTAILSRSGGSQGIGFAVPTEYVASLLEVARRAAGEGAPVAAGPGPATSRGPAAPPGAARPGGGATQSVYLGVLVDDFLELGVRGVRIERVVPGSPAATAGLRGRRDQAPDYVATRRIPWTGHIIRAVDDRQVRTVDELHGALRGRRPGDRVRLTVSVGPDAMRGTADLVLVPPPRRP